MAAFAVLSRTPGNDPIIKARLAELFPDDHHTIGRGQWLVSFKGTARNLYDKIVPEENILKVEAGLAVFRISGYWGLGTVDMWEWMAVATKKGESS